MTKIFLLDSITTHTILKYLKYSSYLKKKTTNVSTICGSVKLIEGSGRDHIILPRRKKFVIDDALHSEKSQRNLLIFKDVHKNGYHIETTNKANGKYLCITTIVSGKKSVLEKLPAFFFGLFYINIGNIKARATIN